jgi:uncharacterized phage-like protein YoqJ
MIYAGTGHRIEKIPSIFALRTVLYQWFVNVSPDAFVCGLANGFDLIAGDLALDLSIPVIGALPWTTQKPRKADREVFARILRYAEEVYPVTEAESYPGKWVYQRRNEWMVDEADAVVTFWDGTAGGTKNCLDYAGYKEKPIENLYEQSIQVKSMAVS